MLKSTLRYVFPILLLLFAGHAFAQNAPTSALIEELTRTENEAQSLDRALDRQNDDKQQATLRDQATAISTGAAKLVEQLETQLKRLDDRLAGLGPVSPDTPETPEITAERENLAKQRSVVDAAIKRARLAGVEATQLAEEIDSTRAAEFTERISERSASPITPRFWTAIVEAFPRDVKRIELYFTQGADQIRQGRDGTFAWQPIIGGIIALLVAFPLRRILLLWGRRLLIEGAPGARIRRSAYALWRIFTGTIAPLLGSFIFVQSLRWAGLVPERWASVVDMFIVAMGYAGFIVALGSALLMRDQPSWRVAPLHDDTANRLTPLSWLLAGVSVFAMLMTAFNTALGASQPALAMTRTVDALLQIFLIIATLFIIGRMRSAHADEEETAVDPMRPVHSIVSLLIWILAVVSITALLLGYINFSLLIDQTIGWAAVLCAFFYLLMAFADDLATTVFARNSALGSALSRGLGLRGSMIDQFGLLLSAAVRIVLAFAALALLVIPIGGGGGFNAVVTQLGVLANGVQIGGVSVSPGAILRGLIVLAIGLALVRVFSGWLEKRYLPATDLDDSGRNSVSLVARYVGIALAVIWALASLNIGIERLALLLSALSVGIGFGLQAITQNFISGLILLAERPIKIGDWVKVGTDEGDVKRISVRSTEIVLADHSTLIVPNSELITKPVLNKTLAGPLGRIQIQFSVPIETDAAAVRDIVLEAFAEEPAVLAEPAPSVFVDAITDSRILFNCFAHVSSPRSAYGPRSNILMNLLTRFRQTGVEIGTVPQKLEVVSDDEEALPFQPSAADKDNR